jgi:hypothetical protein
MTLAAGSAPRDSRVDRSVGEAPAAASRFLRRVGPCARPLVAALSLLSALTATTTAAADVCYQHPVSGYHISNPFGAPGPYYSTGYHRGVDYAGLPVGTPVGAIAEGTVVSSLWQDCQGNVVVVQHPDGRFSSYSHLLSGSRAAVGTGVSRGDTVGQLGATGECLDGAHLHLTLSNSATGYAYGDVVDPYAFIEEHKVCSCDAKGGVFTFSCDGPEAGQTCVRVDEPGDSASSFDDNYLCAPFDFGMKWSSNGKLAGMSCTAVVETAGPNPEAWKDNFLCVPPQSPYQDLEFSMAGPIAGKTCVQWNEPAATSWQDNFLCFREATQFTEGGFAFSSTGPFPGKPCVAVNESADPHTWDDNYFCSPVEIGMKWSSAGPLPDMDCTNVAEGAEPSESTWSDNFVCLPQGAAYKLTWSSAGPIAGKACVRWFEHAEPLSHTWTDNWMCSEPVASSAGGAAGTGAGGAGAAGSTDTAAGSGGAPHGAGGGGAPSTNTGGVGGVAGSAGRGGAGGGAKPAGAAGDFAGGQAGARTDRSTGIDTSSEDGSGCVVGASRSARNPAILVVLALLTARLRRRSPR